MSASQHIISHMSAQKVHAFVQSARALMSQWVLDKGVGDAGPDSSGILALKQQLKLMEQEVTKLRRQQQAVITNVASRPAAAAIATISNLGDCNSVVVHNVHFSATPQIVAAHFSGWVTVNSLTETPMLFRNKCHVIALAWDQFWCALESCSQKSAFLSCMVFEPEQISVVAACCAGTSHDVHSMASCW